MSGACSSPAVAPAPIGSNVAGVNLSSLPVGALEPVANAPVCLGRDAGGVYAMTLTCTHAGCDIGQTGSVSSQGLVCGCHGSQFDVNGNVVVGPASQPLDHFAVTMDGSGNLIINGNEIVDASWRLKV